MKGKDYKATEGGGGGVGVFCIMGTGIKWVYNQSKQTLYTDLEKKHRSTSGFFPSVVFYTELGREESCLSGSHMLKVPGCLHSV